LKPPLGFPSGGFFVFPPKPFSPCHPLPGLFRHSSTTLHLFPPIPPLPFRGCLSFRAFLASVCSVCSVVALLPCFLTSVCSVCSVVALLPCFPDFRVFCVFRGCPSSGFLSSGFLSSVAAYLPRFLLAILAG